jgi:parallel beta-helix repeat protein
MRKNILLDGATVLLSDLGGIVEDNDIDGTINGAGDGMIVRHNTIRHGGEPADGKPGSAISIDGSGTPVVEGNEIIDSPYGIYISGGAKPQVSGNTIRGSVSVAIVVDRGTAPTISGNVIEGNATGIGVGGVTTTPVLSGNKLCDNERNLVVPDGSTLTLAGNTICGVAVTAAP